MLMPRSFIASSFSLASALLVGCGSQDGTVPVAAVPTSGAAAASGATPGKTAIVDVTLPDGIRTPDGQVQALKVNAKGVQIYACKARPDNASTFEWSLVAPEADLFDEQGKAIGKHFAGPSWQLSDGSKVVGKKRTQVDAPEAGAIPWLLVDATGTEGTGALSGIQSIQRVATHGGKAPAAGCDSGHADAESRVPYSATYYFNRAR